MKTKILIIILLTIILSSCKKEVKPVICDFSIDHDTTYVGFTVAFSNLSENATNYEWNFGDHSFGSYAESPNHIYDQPGEYLVSLVAYNEEYNDYKMDTVWVLELP